MVMQGGVIKAEVFQLSPLSSSVCSSTFPMILRSAQQTITFLDSKFSSFRKTKSLVILQPKVTSTWYKNFSYQILYPLIDPTFSLLFNLYPCHHVYISQNTIFCKPSLDINLQVNFSWTNSSLNISHKSLWIVNQVFPLMEQ